MGKRKFMMLVRCLSITSADSFIILCGIPSGHVAFLGFRRLINIIISSYFCFSKTIYLGIRALDVICQDQMSLSGLDVICQDQMSLSGLDVIVRIRCHCQDQISFAWSLGLPNACGGCPQVVSTIFIQHMAVLTPKSGIILKAAFASSSIIWNWHQVQP